MAKHHFIKTIKISKERASAFASCGSITLEASLAFPIFLMAILCFVYLFEVMTTQVVIQSALLEAGKELAQEASVSTLLLGERLEEKIINIVGEERLENSLLTKGSKSLNCSESRCYGNTTMMDLKVAYQLKIPILSFEVPMIKKEEKVRIKGWTGYEGEGAIRDEEDEVYIAETGVVYHSDPKCSYLDLSVRCVEREAIKEEYEVCSRCKYVKEQDMVYVTEDGEHYHTTLGCSAMKRTIYKVKKSELYGIGGCSRCVK